MSQENVEIALQQIDAFYRQDADAVVALVSPEVEWEDSMFWSEGARIYRGRAEVREWLNRVLEPWASTHVEAEEITETSDGRVFARLFLTGRGKASGAETEFDTWTVLWFADGLCARRRVISDRGDALVAVGRRE